MQPGSIETLHKLGPKIGPLMKLVGKTLQDCGEGFIPWIVNKYEWLLGYANSISLRTGEAVMDILQRITDANPGILDVPLSVGREVCINPSDFTILQTVFDTTGSASSCPVSDPNCFSRVFPELLNTPNAVDQIVGTSTPIIDAAKQVLNNTESLIQPQDGSIIGPLATIGFLLAGTLVLVIRETTQRRH